MPSLRFRELVYSKSPFVAVLDFLIGCSLWLLISPLLAGVVLCFWSLNAMEKARRVISRSYTRNSGNRD